MNAVRSLQAARCPVIGFVICVCSGLLSLNVRSQTNSWTNSVSGNWQDAFWSLGLPATNQDVSLTNAGWKALAINPATVQDFSGTLTLNSLTISSPTTSFNTLLMNFAGTSMPLSVRAMAVASNSAVTMFSSALLLDGPGGVGLQLGGEFDQDDSIVAGSQVNVGYNGPGIYNLNSGLFAITNLWVGGMYHGLFNQNGGTNSMGITHVEGGEYILNDGYFAAAIYWSRDGTFRQRGGMLNSSLHIDYGNYILEGGVHIGDVAIPNNSGLNEVAYYDQSNGLQTGGSITVSSENVTTKGGGGYTVRGYFNLHGGTVSCSELDVSGNYDQSGGTNFVSGLIHIFQTSLSSSFRNDGRLCASNIWIDGGAVSIGGQVVVTNEIRIDAGFPSGYLGSGDLTASNITLNWGAHFQFQGNSLNQSGIFDLANGNLSFSGAGTYLLGPLQVGTGVLEFYDSPPCLVHFADSSGMMWGSTFAVRSWNGSVYGGGGDRLIFGANNSALTPQQLSQIQFENPAGLAPGTYPARILATGEVVPDTGASLPPSANLSASTNGSMHLCIGGDIDQTYSIEVSTDFVHWNAWTDQYNTCGSINLDDDAATNCPQRFYRVRQLP